MNDEADVITVVGSLNLDFFIQTPHWPSPGETVLGTGFRREPGGKGANQACAAARLGARVVMIGAVGRDRFGDELVRNLQAFQVGHEPVTRHEHAATGAAFISTNNSGQNQIIVAPGANATLTARDVVAWRHYFTSARAVVVQLEIPVEAVVAALRLGRESVAITVLNPAPAAALDEEILRLCDWIVPNEIEARQLTGLSADTVAGATAAARCLRDKAGGAGVALTLGEKGVWIEAKDFSGLVPGYPITPIDSVGAGDAFIGAFALRLTEKAGAADAARFACAAAALSVTRRGAQSGMPTRAEVESLMGTAWGLA